MHMKIYTKTGDKGLTSLFGGERVLKYHYRIEAYGTVDELNSYIGLLRDQPIDANSREALLEIQDRLFTLGSILATEPGNTKVKTPELHAKDIEFLEKQIDFMNEALPEMHSFVLPGGHQIVSYCHIARCVCRRAERLVVFLGEKELINDEILIYLNRLSDYLFVLSRKLGNDFKVKEITWKPRY